MAELKHLPSTSSVDSIVEVLEKDAGVIIDNIVNKSKHDCCLKSV